MAAAATTRRRTAKATAPKAKPAPAPEELEDEDLVEEEGDGDMELDELEEDEVAETKPAKKASSAQQEVTFGIRDLVAHIKAETGQDTDPRGLRTLIRKMARDKSGRVNREITPGNRTRYDWSGPNDPEVVAIVEAFKNGELEAEKHAKLAALKEQKAAKAAAKKKAAAEVEEADDEEEAPAPRRTAAKKTTPARRRKAAPAPEVVEDDEELDLDDDE